MGSGLRLVGAVDVPIIRAEWYERPETINGIAASVVETMDRLRALDPLLESPFALARARPDWGTVDLQRNFAEGSSDPVAFVGSASVLLMSTIKSFGELPIGQVTVTMINTPSRASTTQEQDRPSNMVIFKWDRNGGTPERRIEALERIGLDLLDLVIDIWKPAIAGIHSGAMGVEQTQRRFTPLPTIGAVTWFSPAYAIPTDVPGAVVSDHLGGTQVVLGDGLPDAVADPVSGATVYHWLADRGALIHHERDYS
jgi:hypothetical protein